MVWLVGAQTRQPIVNEINTSIAKGRRLLVFKLPAKSRDALTEQLLCTASKYCKWQKPFGRLFPLKLEGRLTTSHQAHWERAGDPLYWFYNLRLRSVFFLEGGRRQSQVGPAGDRCDAVSN